jgi:Domain of unknown function (DUF4384)
MTQDEIRKLLGGYATNELSADERRMLFEAALEDQELFDALQNEDALRELLDDPVARDQVRRALGGPVAQKQRVRFGSRRWIFGVAIPAVAAVIVIAIMNRATTPTPTAPPVEIASNQSTPSQITPRQAAPKPTVAPPEIKSAAKKKIQAKALDEIARATPAAAPPPVIPAPVIPRPAQLGATSAAMASLRVPGRAPIPAAVRQQFAAGFALDAPLYQGPLVQYSLVRSGPAGDAVRIQVTTGIAGYLALYQMDTAGNSKRIYPSNQPASEPAVRISPGAAVQIPNIPVDTGARLRLVLVPSATGAIGTLGGVVNGALSEPASVLQATPTPLIVDVPLAPN